MSDLMPCPFCGHAPEIMRNGDYQAHPFTVRCNGCGVDIGNWSDESECVARWNARPPTAADGVTDEKVDQFIYDLALAIWQQENEGESPEIHDKEKLEEFQAWMRKPVRAALAAAMGVRG